MVRLQGGNEPIGEILQRVRRYQQIRHAHDGPCLHEAVDARARIPGGQPGAADQRLSRKPTVVAFINEGEDGRANAFVARARIELQVAVQRRRGTNAHARWMRVEDQPAANGD